jgi:hypothetical protein
MSESFLMKNQGFKFNNEKNIRDDIEHACS